MTNAKTDLGMPRIIPAFIHEDGTTRGPFTRFTVLPDRKHEWRYAVYERNPAAPLEIDLCLSNMPFDEAVREAQRLWVEHLEFEEAAREAQRLNQERTGA